MAENQQTKPVREGEELNEKGLKAFLLEQNFDF